MRVLTRLHFPIPTIQNVSKGSLGLTVTDPLHLYRNLVDSGIISPDPSQHRAALIVQGVYERLLDYKPERYTDLKQRLDAVTKSIRALNAAQRAAEPSIKGSKPKPSWRDSPYLPESWQSPQAQSNALIKIMSKEDDLLNIQSPRGLLLSGSVGCGKSMLADLLASSLPLANKQRIHFDTFMLSIYSKLEEYRKRTDMHDTYSLLHIAREMVATSTVLFLDEFQMPDKTAGKIIKSLFNNFFLLGGVLVATSNRLPEDLVAAQWRREEFGFFEEVLKSRCEIWDMGSDVDWRRRGEEGRIVAIGGKGTEEKSVATIPKFYYLKEGDMVEAWEDSVGKASSGHEKEWTARLLSVYGRDLVLNRTRNGTAMFTFEELCVEALGPADYITIASNFPTIIVDRIPVLTSKSHRHEARRFITLLDAIYECRCKLLLRAEVPIEDLFFPDAAEKELGDSLHSETFAEAHQDLTVPFRPNISLYEEILGDPDSPIAWKKNKGFRIADQDSDFTGKVDFMTTGKYTGEDEKFSFKRAVSRVWEVCGEKWWDNLSHSNLADGTRHVAHSPLPKSLRRWEKHDGAVELSGPSGDIARHSHDTEHKDSLLRPDAPKFLPVHIWGVIDNWGKRAGRWGLGVNAYKYGDTRDKDSKSRDDK